MEKPDEQRLSDYHNNVMQREKSNKMERFIFKPGDLVKYAPYGDRIFELDDYECQPYCLKLKELNSIFNTFTKHGLLQEDHKYPIITFIYRPKNKVTNKIERWINIYQDDPKEIIHQSKGSADDHATSGRIACVKLTGSYEIEE